MEKNQDAQIACANGIQAHLLELEQHTTYRKLLDGAPTYEVNEQCLSNTAEYQSRIPTHLVRQAGATVEKIGARSDRLIVILPHLRCTGQFEVGTHRRPIRLFQNGWAPPIDPSVTEELRSLDSIAMAFDEVSAW